MQNLVALAPDTGNVRWTTLLPGQSLGGPVVAPNGSIVVLVDRPGPDTVAVVEPTGAMRSMAQVEGLDGATQGVFGIAAVARDGTLVLESDVGQGVNGLLAVSASSGTVLWRHPAQLLAATITEDGSVLAHDSFDITLIDLATGTTRWVLKPPHPANCIAEVEVTGRGGLVGLQCDGTLFGVADGP